MRLLHPVVLLLLVLPPAQIARARDDADVETLVVTGSREPRPLGRSVGSVDVISGDELRGYRYDGVLEALRHRAGLHADQPGARGSRASVYTRGLDPNHTLVLIDGVVVNDPTNARGGSFDFSTLGIDAIERIEIVRGPVSAVHGSDALAGAIHVITRDGRGADSAAVDLSGGRYGYFRGYGRVSGQRGPVDFSLAGSYQDEGDPEDIGNFEGGALNASLGFDLPGEARLRGILRASDSTVLAFPEFSGGPDLAVIREFEERDIQDLQAGITLSDRPRDWLDVVATASAFLRREDHSSPGVPPAPPTDPFGIPAEPDTRDELQRYEVSLQATAEGSHGLSLTGGGDVRWERGESQGDPRPGLGPPDFDERRAIGGPFVEAQWDAAFGLEAVAGTRVDFREDGSPVWTPRVNVAYRVEPMGFELQGSYGRGFKLPSFFALGNAAVGDPNLRPERSDGWEIGAHQSLFGGRLEGSVTWFDLRVRDLIDFDLATFKLINLPAVDSRGVELELRARPVDPVELRGHLTWSDTEDQDGRRLRNRPRWRGGVALHWTPLESIELRVQALFVGDVVDSSVPTGPVTLDPYERVDLVLAWSPRHWLEAYVAIDNLLDADYEEAVGFPSLGIRPRAGLRVRY